MISGFIVYASLLLAGGFLVAWLARPELRRRIERPKHLFADQVRQYDEQCRQDVKATGERDDGPE